MKTPKREMPEGMEEAEKYLRGTNCQFMNMKARWKRKNRDRQQRRIIATLANLCEQAQGQVLTVANCYYSLRERYEANTSCHGQDVEGS